MPTRRDLLKIGGLLAGASVTGTLPNLVSAKTVPGWSARALIALQRDMDGRLLMPGDQGFPLAAAPNNARWGNVAPKAIALCTTDSDVQRCIRWATDHKEQFAIRSGGHSYAGFSTTPGLLLSVRYMDGVTMDLKNGTATVRGGANNQDVANALRGAPFAIPSGRCPTVGASGLVLGGGWGFAASHAGLTCDSLLSTDVVMANAAMLSVSNKQADDLFWAVRGAGGGNFGVHTSFTFKLHEVGDITTFNIVWPPGKQVELLEALQKLQLDNPRAIATRSKARPQIKGALPARSDLLVESLGVYWGKADALRELIAPLVTMLRPRVMDIREQSYWDARDYLVTDDPTGLYDMNSSYVGTTLGGEAIDTMLSWMSRWPGGSLLQENMGILFAMGGAVKDIPVDGTAYAHRNSNFVFEQETMWSPLDRPEVVQRQREWLAQYFVAMQRFLQPRSYVNFPNRDMKDWANRYYGENLSRLSRIKQKYDPTNVFRFAQSVPLAGAGV